MSKESVKAVVAFGPRKAGIVVATDSGTLAFDVEEIANNICDVGLPDPPAEGVWLFDGTVTWESFGGAPWDGCEPPSPVYDGEYRRPVDMAELVAWCDMAPPPDPRQTDD